MSKFPDETTTLACLVAGSTHVSRLLTLIPLVLTHSSGIHFAPIFGTWEGGDDAADLSRGAEVEESPEATENELDDGTNEGAKEAMETQHHSV